MYKIRIGSFAPMLSVLFLVISASYAVSQTAKSSSSEVVDNTQILQELVVEVRQLRLTLQRANINAFRAQLAIERLKVQEARVERITNQLEENQNDLVGVKTLRAQTVGQIRDTESQVRTETDAKKREEAETALKEFKRSLEQQNDRETALNEQRGNLLIQLQAEQAKVDELSNTLAGIQSDLEQMVKETMKKDPATKK